MAASSSSINPEDLNRPRTPVNVPIIHTSVVRKLSGARISTSFRYMRDKAMRALGDDMTDKFVGPMPPEDFIKDFLPRPASRRKWTNLDIQKAQSISTATSEVEMYEPFIEAFKRFCPGLTMDDTHSHLDPKRPQSGQPDISIYSLDAKKQPIRENTTDFGTMEIHGEFKYTADDDGFNDVGDGDFEHDSETSRDTRGEITTYASGHISSQFRFFVFSILVIRVSSSDTLVRLLRWDRGGTVVTEAFPITDRWLADFLWAYNQASPKERGVDTSVRRITTVRELSHDTNNAPDDVVEITEQRAAIVRQRLDLSSDDPLFAFSVSTGSESVDFWGSEPSFTSPEPPAGRSTRGFVVYDPRTDNLAWLKDTWRIAGMAKEADIYKSLNEAHVPHVPICLYSCDVDPINQVTLTDKYTQKSWFRDRDRATPPLSHVHSLLVLDTVGDSLTHFSSTKELTIAVADALEAHQVAHEKVHILHRDISAGNILIVRRKHSVEGMLIDWELSRRLNDPNPMPRRLLPTGTWQFISARLLRAETDIEHTPEDDYESFLWVLCWVLLRFTKNSATASDLKMILAPLFDEWSVGPTGKPRGGVHKRSALRGNELVTYTAPDHPVLPALIERFTELCALRYQKDLPSAAAVAQYETYLKSDNKRVRELAADSHAGVYVNLQRQFNAAGLRSLFSDALSSTEWPVNDKAE